MDIPINPKNLLIMLSEAQKYLNLIEDFINQKVDAKYLVNNFEKILERGDELSTNPNVRNDLLSFLTSIDLYDANEVNRQNNPNLLGDDDLLIHCEKFVIILKDFLYTNRKFSEEMIRFPSKFVALTDFLIFLTKESTSISNTPENLTCSIYEFLDSSKDFLAVLQDAKHILRFPKFPSEEIELLTRRFDKLGDVKPWFLSVLELLEKEAANRCLEIPDDLKGLWKR